MKVVLAFIVVTVLGIAAVVTTTNGSQAQTGYRVDVLFDTAKGLLPGQLVKVAGARSGEIVDVKLTDDFKARVQLRVDPRFGPFTRDARCTIQPEGLIGENFVQCDPGSRTEPELRAGDDGAAPTVPVTRTTVPVSFPELFDLATIPVRQRLTVLLNELGLATAARGEDINEILRRANPTLGLVRRLGAVLDGQRAQLGQAVESTDALLAGFEPKRGRAAELIGSSGRVTGRVVERREDLRAALRRLPALLRGTRGTVRELDGVLRDGTPVLEDLEDAAPGVARVVDEAVPFARAARPALVDLGAIATQGAGTLRRARTAVRLLRAFSGPALPAGQALDALLTDLRDRGVIENLLDGLRLQASTLARYDAKSHMLPLKVTLSSCSLIEHGEAPSPGCDARYTKVRGQQRKAARKAPAKRPAGGAPEKAAPAAPGAPPAPKPGAPPVTVPGLPAVPDTGIDALDDIVDGLLPPGGPPLLPAPSAPKDSAVTDLLDFLLG